MVVLFYMIEAEILTNLDAPDRGPFFAEAAGAYRARGKCLEAMGRSTEAASDRKRADSMEAKAKTLSKKLAPKATKAAIEVINVWEQPVTLIVAGVPHRLEIGEQKTISTPEGAVSYEMQAGQYRAAGTLQAGKTYNIQPTPTP